MDDSIIKCSRCKNQKPREMFISDAGKVLKSCKRCREVSKKLSDSKRCKVCGKQQGRCKGCPK